MEDKGKINSKDTLFEETLVGIKTDIRLTSILLTCFFFLALFVKFIFGIPLAFFVFIILFVWILAYLSYNYFIKYKKNEGDLISFHLRNNIVDLLFLTAIIHYLGGVEWIGAIFYVAVLSWSGSVLPKKKVFILCFLAIFFYSTLATLEYFQFLPHRTVFGPSSGFYQNPVYILIQILALTFIFLFITENYNSLSGNLKKNQKELIRVQREIEEAKTVLEIKVAARTKELKELAEGLDEQVKQRTKELQEKMEELERFNKLAIGRELKMIELKEEIKELKEELEKYRPST